MASASSTPASFPSQNTAQFTKLTETNYLIWLRQIKPYLHGAKFWGYVDGSIPQPSQTLTTSATQTEAAREAPNPKYDEWFTVDQQIVSLITTSLTESVSQLTIGFDTSKEIWDCLASHFSQRSSASASSLKLQLLELNKGSQSVDDYLRHAKSLADQLAAIKKPVSDEDLVLATLHGLGPDYLMLRTALSQHSSLPTFTELRARIFAFDAQQPNHQDQGTATALFHNSNTRRDNRLQNGKNSSSNGRNFNRSKRYNSSRNFQQPQNNFSLQPFQPQHNAFGPYSSSSWAARPKQSDGILGPALTWCSNCHTNQHGHQQCTHKFLGPTTVAPFAGAHFAADPNWYPDTGATHHMTAMPVNNPKQYGGPHNVYMGNGDSMSVSHTGNLPISLGSSQFSLQNVFHVPSLRKNLLSVARFTKDNNVIFLFAPDFYQIYCLHSGHLLFQGPCKDGLYPLQLSHASSTPQALAAIHSSIWHNRLGHPSSDVSSRLSSTIGSKVSFRNFCSECALSKSHRLPFENNRSFADSPFYVVHSDVWSSSTSSTCGFKYYVLFTDEFSRYSWIYPMHRKNEVLTHFKKLVSKIQTLFGITIKFLQSDNGSEYVNHEFTKYCNSLGIQQRFSCPHTPQQNGLAERKHRHISTMARTLLLTSGAPHKLWVEAVLTSVYLINRLPTHVLNWDTPCHRLYGIHPSYSYLRVFGCSCFPYLGPYVSGKLSSRSLECVFLGYSPQHKGYRCLDPKTGRLYVSRHVIFNENSFPYKNMQVQAPGPLEFAFLPSPTTFSRPSETLSQPRQNELSNAFHETTMLPFTNSSTPIQPPVSISQPPVITYHRRNKSIPHTTPNEVVTENRPETTPIESDPILNAPTVHEPAATTVDPPPVQPTTKHPMITRSKDGTLPQHKQTDRTTKHPVPQALLSVIENSEPTCYTEASKHAVWRNAMTEEINALLKNETWVLVPPSSSHNTVGCKWVFRIKRNPDGTIERHKARLVAKGFHQQQGIDYEETFSPVIKPATIRTVLSLAVSRRWALRQLDVKNAFLHGFLNEDVYMTQPPGFVDPSRPDYVCKLLKAIYGLRQAPRAWFEHMKSFLISAGFVQSLADPSLFIFRQGNQTIYFLLYVDDIVITGSDNKLIQELIQALGRNFDIKDLGPLHYFLGLQVTSLFDGLHISQLKYAHDILLKHDMLHSKAVSTPMSAKMILTSADGDILPNATVFREIVGSLQYLTITRPDIAYAVNSISQYMSQPRTSHLLAAKRILRYIKGTLDHGLFFRPQYQPAGLSAYSDADWAGCPDTRRSTSGYLCYIGTNLVSWCSKNQPTIARSSAESEYRALSHASAETTWLAFLLYELGAHLHFPILLYCDNLSATYMASNPVFHARTKHIELDYHFVREKVVVGSHRVCYIPSVDQPADLLTKPLYKHRHSLLTNKLVRQGPSSLRGDIKVIAENQPIIQTTATIKPS